MQIAKKTGEVVEVLPGFFPIEKLWTGEQAIFPSEQSARWFIRSRRDLLIAHSAISKFTGRTFVNLKKLAMVAERDSINAMESPAKNLDADAIDSDGFDEELSHFVQYKKLAKERKELKIESHAINTRQMAIALRLGDIEKLMQRVLQDIEE
jgi:hypothetical protein